MKTRYDLTTLKWKLSGWIPESWRLQKTAELGLAAQAEIPALDALVPGSVQHALLKVGLIPDWNVGQNARFCEWVENRQWIYETSIPDAWLSKGRTHRLRCEGLDYRGWILVNGREAEAFSGSHIPHVVDLTAHLKETGNALQIVFDTPPRWLGQFGRTSQIKDWKVRFNYMWDWTVRLVQLGIWDAMSLEVSDGSEIREWRCSAKIDAADGTGTLKVSGWVDGAAATALVRVALKRDGQVVRAEELHPTVFNLKGIGWHRLGVDLWWPNLEGNQALYQLELTLLGQDRRELDHASRTIGFKSVVWKPCQDAPVQADAWICSVNGRDIPLKGANWVPIRPNFADVTAAQYERYLATYRDLGFNLLRVWGGAVLEREVFYRLCDELGILVWQEFPLSSSGVDDYPPEDPRIIQEAVAIAETYIERRQHHVSLLLWCGGNELITTEGGGYRPVDERHPLIRELKAVAQTLDPDRRFLPTSPSGPTVHGNAGTFGHGLHWDVHGPWKPGEDLEKWRKYWENDDALFRSELGASGTSSVELIRKYAGELDPLPIAPDNPLWRRPIGWWLDLDHFVREQQRPPNNLEEYVAWDQERQRAALSFAVKTCLDRFPRCGGYVIWMGHDCFPCAANTAIIDFEGNPKPAGLAVGTLNHATRESKAS